MAFRASLTFLKAEATCALCLEYLKDPVTIDCDHSFCYSCLHLRWEGLQAIFPCPICLHHCSGRDFGRSTQLHRIVDTVKALLPRRSKRIREKGRPRCEKHNQFLALFCEEDLKLLCPQCVMAPKHQDHQLIPIEQAATHHRKKLKGYVETLSNEDEGAAQRSEMLNSELVRICKRAKNQRRYARLKHAQFIHSLDKDYKMVLSQLGDKEEEIIKILMAQGALISDHISSLNHLLTEIIEKCGQAEAEFVADIDSIHKRYKELKGPELFSYLVNEEDWRLPRQHFGLQTMINQFKMDITFDPKRAHPDLIISDNRRQVRLANKTTNLPQHHECLILYPSVLSAEGLDAGRHFWQVEIKGTGQWSLGVYRESENSLVVISPHDTKSLQEGMPRCATHGPNRYMKIGVFLDLELGELSYYLMNTRSHFETVTDTFTGKVWPYFAIGSSSVTLEILR